MSEVSNIGRSSPILPQGAENRATRTQTHTENPSRASDRVEFSEMSRLLSLLSSIEVRQDLIEQAKTNIANGFYETEEVINAVVDAVAQELE